MIYLKNVKLFITAIASCVLVACDSSGQLPPGAEVRISPESHSIDITQVTDARNSCLFNPDNYIDTPLMFSIHDADGSPLGDVDVSVHVEYSGNSFLGPPVLSLYDDLNSNGVVDADTELVSGREDDGYTGKTAKYSGEKAMLLRINLSCPYRGNLYVRSQYATNSMNIEVNAENVVVIDTTIPES